MIAVAVGRIVDLARRNALAIALAGLLLSLGGGFYAATHLTIDTDIEHMLPTGLAWRQNEIALDRAFPQNDSLLVIVIDGQTGDLAERAARELAAQDARRARAVSLRAAAGWRAVFRARTACCSCRSPSSRPCRRS